MTTHLLSCLKALLLVVRYGEPRDSLSALVLSRQLLLVHQLARQIDEDQCARLARLAANASSCALDDYKRATVAALSRLDPALLSRLANSSSSQKDR